MLSKNVSASSAKREITVAFLTLREMICGKCLWSQSRPCSRLLVLNWALCQDKMLWPLWGSYRLPNRSSAGISLHTIISYTMMLWFYLLTELYHTLGPEVLFLRERKKSHEVAISEREEREKRKKTSGSGWCKSHYHATQPITTHLSVNNSQSEYIMGSDLDPSSLIDMVRSNNCHLVYQDLNSPNLPWAKYMNSVGRIGSLTNFNPNKTSPAKFSILYHS